MDTSCEYLKKIETLYDRFMAQPNIKSFLNKGGRIFIATEKIPVKIIEKWIELGHRHFSEKYVQETVLKWPKIRSNTLDIKLHQYGHLQSNKLTKALQLYDGLESLDSENLVKKLSKIDPKISFVKNLWIQINLGAEPQKSGLLIHQLQAFIETCKDYRISPRGLMAIPPRHEDPSNHFQYLRTLADTHGLQDCIMGMSQDYAKAIEMGSTLIRIKRALIPSEGSLNS